MNLTDKEKKALRIVREYNDEGSGLWKQQLEEESITKYTMDKLEKKGLVYREISPFSGHMLYWIKHDKKKDKYHFPDLTFGHEM